MTARSALGVGESMNTRGEDVRTKGSGGSDRSTDEDTGDGAASASARTGIDEQEPRESR
ncbi:MAG: hypothetical protein M3O28_03450 [Actinomycetota bacterium]|nr:hypothetical protein [Actinomycetota bacterium]